MKRTLRFLLWTVVTIVAAYGILFFTPLRPVLPGYHYVFYTPARYKAVCAEEQDSLARIARRGDLRAAAGLLREGINEKLFPFWQGTRWGFNGTTETPGHGSIACGFFVTTLLRDLGVPVEREEYARMASEPMIRLLVSSENIQRYSRVPLDKFVNDIKTKGDQLYVVGLDSHTGFLVCEAGEVYFIHSSGRWPWAVVKERAVESVVLEKSNYRVTGCLTRDVSFLQHWLQAVQH